MRASFQTSTLTVGGHTINAQFNPSSPNFSASSIFVTWPLYLP